MSTRTARDHTDFASYVAEQRPLLRRMAIGITGDPGTAEDLLHTVLISVLPRWEGLRDRGAADAYVRRAMVNRYRSWHRRPNHAREVLVAELPHTLARGSDADPAATAALHTTLWPMVAALPARQRATLVLRYYEGLGERETALALGTSVGAVKSNTSRALASLRRQAVAAGLADQGDRCA